MKLSVGKGMVCQMAEAAQAAPEKRQKRYVGVKETLIYGIANGGQCMSYTFLSSYLTYFFVNVFNIEPGAVATMIFVLGIWDTINDPLMGSFIDKTRTRYGKLRPYLFLVPIPLAVATVMLFSGPMFFAGEPSNSIKKIVYMYISYLIWEMLYTIGDVPFWGLSASNSPNPLDRSRSIGSARFISSILGGIPGLVIAPVIDIVQSGTTSITLPQAFAVLGLVVSVVGMGLFSLSGICCKERILQPMDDPQLLDGFKSLIHNKPLLIIVLANVLGCLGGIWNTFQNYLYIDVLGSASLGIILGIPGAVTGFLSYAVVPFLKKRMDNKQVLIFSTVFRAILNAVCFFIGLGFLHNTAVLSLIIVVRGTIYALFNAVDMIIPTEMIGDTVDYMEWKSGKRNEGMSFSVLTFVGKFTGSMSKSFGTAALTLIGYQTAVNGQIVVQTMDTQRGIWAFFTILTAIFSLIGIIPYIFYKLDGKTMKKVRADLAERREQLTEEVTEMAAAGQNDGQEAERNG